LLLTLPTENYLAEQMAVVDVESIHRAREFVQKKLATQLLKYFTQWYQDNHREESGQFDTGAIGRRRVKNICLGYLSKLGKDNVYQIAEQQFNAAQNMTDQVAALSVILNSQHPSREQCLQAFFQQWQEEPLVIDKWFTLQAIGNRSDTFATVKNLMRHVAFDLKNPNRVRALIGAFSLSNQLHFHAANGQGYKFLADQVIVLNALNPQVASRMAGALTQWRRYDKNRQTLMRAQLGRIISTQNISPDLYEVVSKSLAQS
jgi:aminopeptidase N